MLGHRLARDGQQLASSVAVDGGSAIGLGSRRRVGSASAPKTAPGSLLLAGGAPGKRMGRLWWTGGGRHRKYPLLAMRLEQVMPGGPPGARYVEVTGLAYDNRAVALGTLFFCVLGFSRDGHDFGPLARPSRVTHEVLRHVA